MPIKRRRRLAAIVSLLVCGVIAGLVAGVSAAADRERITGYWTGAVLADDGLHVTEVIDYDFGPAPKHGIFRTVPDLDADSVEVSSSTGAPTDTDISSTYSGTKIRVGDPDTTITGRHRYRIDYLLAFDAVVQDGVFAWDAVGTEWTVPISNVRVALALAADLEGVTCKQGTVWDDDPCEISQVGAGRYTVSIDSLGTGEGATIAGTLRDGAPPDALPVPPAGTPDDPGAGILVPFLLALVASLLGAWGARYLTRRAGRERVWTGGAADAAFGDHDEGLGSRRVDEAELAEMATIEFEPPRDTSAVEGGILLLERVDNNHKSAWLLESAIRGEIDIGGDDDPVLTRGDAPAHPSVSRILDAMFGDRNEVDLGSYDSKFSKGWGTLGADLKSWLHDSAHWDHEGRTRRNRVRGWGVLALLVTLVIALVGAGLSARNGGAWLLFIAWGAAAAGAAIGAMAASSELLVRTEAGSAMWLRIESFRRFLHDSEARHVDEAAEKGVLRHYTAWAVALGESKAWTQAVEAAAAANPEMQSTLARDLTFVTVGSHIAGASRAASTAPSSSSGGGGSFGGSVGGGGGGGGGGSW